MLPRSRSRSRSRPKMSRLRIPGRRVKCSSARTSASSRARSLALFWTRENLDEYHFVCTVIARNPRHLHHHLFWIMKSSTVLIFRPAGIKCDDIKQPSLATQPNTITEAGFFNCVIECIAGGDSCVLTVGDFIRNEPVANMMSGGQTSLRPSLATTSQRVDSMMGCYQPYNLIVFNSDILNKKAEY